MDPGLVEMVEQGRQLTAAELPRARADQGVYAAAWAEWMRNYDLLLTPTLPCTAFPVGLNRPERSTVSRRAT